MTILPEGNESWQFYHQNYARLLLKGSSRDQIDVILSEIKRIQGDDEEQIMRDFLNHEKESMAAGTPLVKPQCVIDEEAKYRASLHNPMDKDARHEKQKADIAASDQFIEKLAS